MTSFIVALDKDISIDDMNRVANAIQQLRGVVLVTPSTTNSDYWVAKEHVYEEIEQRLRDLLRGSQ